MSSLMLQKFLHRLQVLAPLSQDVRRGRAGGAERVVARRVEWGGRYGRDGERGGGGDGRRDAGTK